MATNAVSTYQHPLDSFLEADPCEYDNLEALARKFAAEPFDECAFRADLVAKLTKFSYQPERLTGNEQTFHEILTQAGVLDLLLESSTLRELRKGILLKKIAERDRELQREKKAFDGETLRFHNDQAKQIWKDLGAFETLFDKYNAQDEAPHRLYEKLNSQGRKHLLTRLMSKKYRTSRDVLLEGRDEDLASKKAIVSTLTRKIQTQKNRRRGIFDIFLCQLAELIVAPPDAKDLPNGYDLNKAIIRSR